MTPRPSTARASRRRRNRRIRYAIEITIGLAAIWFILHPSAFPRFRPPDVDPGSDSMFVDSIVDSAIVSKPGRRFPTTALPEVLIPKGHIFRSIEERARAGERIAVTMTAYCLQGRTRRGNLVRDGIIAVDRKLFPLGREVDLFLGQKSYGRFLADDTGGVIKGGRIDIWMGDCTAARRFGRRRGYAQLVPRAPK